MAVSVAHVSSRRARATVYRAHPPLTQCQVAVNFNKHLYAQQKSRGLDAAIDEVWRQKTAANSHLFNGSKFRLANCVARQDGKLELKLGLTSYKDLCGTNLSERVDEYVEAGARDHQDRYSYLSQTLGVGLLLLTSDGQLALLRRASWTGEAGGRWDRPGGHPEPSSVEGLEAERRQPPPEGEAASGGLQTALEEDILQEVWRSIASEASDEVGVPPPPDLRLLGLSCNADAGDRPSLEFIGSAAQTGAEVRAAYDAGRHAEADESTALLLLPSRDVAVLVELLRRRYAVEAAPASGGDGHPESTLGDAPGETTESPVRQEGDGANTVSRGDGAGGGGLPAGWLEDVALNCAPALVGALLLAGPLLTPQL